MRNFRSVTSSAISAHSQTPEGQYAAETDKPSAGTDENWSDLPGNIIPSATSFLGGIANAVVHPLDTISSLASVAGGAVGLGGEESKRAFSGVKDFFMERYGGIDNIKRTIINDPVGFAADLSVFLDLGAGAAGTASKAAKVAGLSDVAGTAGRTSEILSGAAKATNPLTLGAKAVTKPVSMVIGKAARPLAESKDIASISAAERIGAELPASMASQSPIVRTVEAIVNKGMFGGSLYPRVQKVAETMVDAAKKMISDTGASSDLSSTGRAISEGFGTFKQKYIDLKNELYDSIELPSRPVESHPGYAPSSVVRAGGIVEAPKSAAFAHTILGTKEGAAAILGSSKDAKAFADVAKNLSSGKISFDDMRSAIQELNQKVGFSNDPVIVGNKAQWSKLAATMEDEFIASLKKIDPVTADKLAQANAYYADVTTMLGNTWAKNIAKFADQPDKILGSILSPSTSIEDIPKILSVAGEDARPAIQASMMETIFKDAKNSDGMFKPEGIAGAIKHYGEDKLSAILSPEQIQIVKDIDTLARSMGKAAKITEGSQTAFITKALAYMTGFSANPMITMKILIGDALIGSFVSSKAGQNFLINGFKGSKLPDLMAGFSKNVTRTSEAGKIEERAKK